MNELTDTEKGSIDRALEKQIHQAFDYIYSTVELGGSLLPSQVARYLDRAWDLGDYYRDWRESDPEWEWN